MPFFSIVLPIPVLGDPPCTLFVFLALWPMIKNEEDIKKYDIDKTNASDNAILYHFSPQNSVLGADAQTGSLYEGKRERGFNYAFVLWRYCGIT